MSISALSDHDFPPIRLWWRKHPEQAKQVSRLLGWIFHQDLMPEYQLQLLWQDYHSNSLLHIEMLQDILPPSLSWPANKERINIPGTTSKKNWTYRYKLSIEELTTSPDLKNVLREMLSIPLSSTFLMHTH